MNNNKYLIFSAALLLFSQIFSVAYAGNFNVMFSVVDVVEVEGVSKAILQVETQNLTGRELRDVVVYLEKSNANYQADFSYPLGTLAAGTSIFFTDEFYFGNETTNPVGPMVWRIEYGDEQSGLYQELVLSPGV